MREKCQESTEDKASAATAFPFAPGVGKRILILCGDDAAPVRAANVYAETLKEHDIRFLEERVLSFRRIAVFSLRRLKRFGLLSLLGAYACYLEKLLFDKKAEAKGYRPALTTTNFSSDPAIAAYIRSFRPHMVIVGFCGLLSPDFLQRIDCPVLNTHPGINPRYRGFGNIWAFFENNMACAGFTIHAVDAGIDTGKRLSVSRLDFTGIPFAEIEPYAAEQAARHLAGLILGRERAGIPAEFADLPSAFYGVPTWAVVRKARRNYENRYGCQQPASDKNAVPLSSPEAGIVMIQSPPSRPRHILITGAGGGLGGALAQVYAAPDTRLTLWGRNRDRLEAVAALCRDKGATTTVISRDVRQYEAVRQRLLCLEAEHPVDLAFLNAGVSSGTLPGGGAEPVEDACRTMEVNATAAINMAGLLLAAMAARRAGQVVFTSSLAALYPLPDSPAYCAAKVAVSSYARAMRGALSATPVRVSVLYPGYVDTPMSRRLAGPQPFRWSAEKAAGYIRERLDSGSDTIIFPRLLALGTCLLHLLPPPLALFFLRRFGFSIAPDAEASARQSRNENGDPTRA